jgi:hypothetical protein
VEYPSVLLKRDISPEGEIILIHLVNQPAFRGVGGQTKKAVFSDNLFIIR